jgi:hypothetical protein
MGELKTTATSRSIVPEAIVTLGGHDAQARERAVRERLMFLRAQRDERGESRRKTIAQRLVASIINNIQVSQ